MDFRPSIWEQLQKALKHTLRVRMKLKAMLETQEVKIYHFSITQKCL